MSRFKNIYIMGPGRSGSTIIEILLRNSRDVFGVGELTHIVRDGFIDNAVCSCSRPMLMCTFWKVILNRLSWKKEDIPSFLCAIRSVESHLRFPLVALGLVSRKRMRWYLEINKQLFDVIEDTVEESVIVDSSKYAGRALSLVRGFPGRFKVICLTRSPEGIISSFRKQDAAEQKPKSVLETLVYYCYVMACLRTVLAFLGDRVLRVSYEQLTADVNQVLDRIESWASLDLSETRQALEQDAWLDVGHIVTGNRIRRQGRVKFRPSQQRPEVRGAAAKLAVNFMRGYSKLLGM